MKASISIRISSVLIILMFPTLCYSQERPNFLPEDIESPNHVKCNYCKPGVKNKSRSRGLEISYAHIFNAVMEDESEGEEEFDLSEFYRKRLNIKFRFPIINKESLKVIGGVFYRPEYYVFTKIGNDRPELFDYLNKRAQKSTGVEATVLKSWDENKYTLFRTKTQFNGTYKGLVEFGSDQAIFSAGVLMGFKKGEDKEWGVGLNFNKSFRQTTLLPFFMYNKTFNNRWGIESLLPAMITLRHNISDENILLLGVRYGSRSSHLDIVYPSDAASIYDLNHSEMKAAFTLEKLIHSWLWIDATAGFQFNFSTDFVSRTIIDPSFKSDPRTSPFFKVGVFLSLPDKQTRE